VKVSEVFVLKPDQEPENEVFRKTFLISFAVHVSFFLVMGLKLLFFPAEPLNLEATIKVDLLGLPDKVQLPPTMPDEPPSSVTKVNDSKPTELTAKPKPQDMKPVSPTLIPTKPSALDKIRKIEREEKRQEAIDKIRDDLKEEEREQMKETLRKGQIVSPGSQLTGRQKAEFNDYLERVRAHIRQYWSLPEWLPSDSLRAVVKIYVESSGRIRHREMELSSGDGRFDEFALGAVDNASPLPIPPAKFVDLVGVQGISLGLPH
jgi:TonB family protein